MEENYVLSGDSKGYVRVWNLVTGKLVKEIQVCGLSQAVVGIHVVRKEDTVEVRRSPLKTQDRFHTEV